MLRKSPRETSNIISLVCKNELNVIHVPQRSCALHVPIPSRKPIFNIVLVKDIPKPDDSGQGAVSLAVGVMTKDQYTKNLFLASSEIKWLKTPFQASSPYYIQAKNTPNTSAGVTSCLNVKTPDEQLGDTCSAAPCASGGVVRPRSSTSTPAGARATGLCTQWGGHSATRKIIMESNVCTLS